MYRKVEDLQVDDVYEYWENRIPYSARVWSITVEANSVYAVVAAKGGVQKIEFTKGAQVKLLAEDDDHFSDIGLVGQRAPTTVRGVPID